MLEIERPSIVLTIYRTFIWAIFTLQGDGFAFEIDIAVACSGICTGTDHDDIAIIGIIDITPVKIFYQDEQPVQVKDLALLSIKQIRRPIK